MMTCCLKITSTLPQVTARGRLRLPRYGVETKINFDISKYNAHPQYFTSSIQTVLNVLNINIPRGKHINNPVTIFTCNQRHKLRMREHTWQHGGYFEQTSYTEKRVTTDDNE